MLGSRLDAKENRRETCVSRRLVEVIVWILELVTEPELHYARVGQQASIVAEIAGISD
jgi:hypothetical protein